MWGQTDPKNHFRIENVFMTLKKINKYEAKMGEEKMSTVYLESLNI